MGTHTIFSQLEQCIQGPGFPCRASSVEVARWKKSLAAYHGSSRVSRNTDSFSRASVVSGYSLCETQACVYHLSKLALRVLKGNQLQIGVSQRFPVKSHKLLGGFLRKQHSATLQCAYFHEDFN